MDIPAPIDDLRYIKQSKATRAAALRMGSMADSPGSHDPLFHIESRFHFLGGDIKKLLLYITV